MFGFAGRQKSPRDVVITGRGAVTPLGNSVQETWERLRAGHRAGRRLRADEIDHFDQLTTFIGYPPLGAPARTPPLDTMPVERLRRHDSADALLTTWNSEPFVRMLIHALLESAHSAGLDLNAIEGDRTGCVIGASKGGLRTLEQLVGESVRGDFLTACRGRSHPDLRWDFAAAADATVKAAALLTGATAFQSCPVAACASGLVSVLLGALAIHRGECDVCFVGSSDAALRASVQAAYHRLRVISRHGDGRTACRPFDRNRNGFLIGEGAGVLVLESRAHAERRGAHPRASLVAGGWLTDTSGMTQIDTHGSAVAELMARVLRRIPDERPVDWVNLHGTGTRSNDLAESAAVRQSLGSPLPVVASWKGATGHLLGAAGSVETCLTVESLIRREIPASANCETADPECGIRPNVDNVRMPSMHRAMKLSLGFGGHIACAILDREQCEPETGTCGNSAAEDPAGTRT